MVEDIKNPLPLSANFVIAVREALEKQDLSQVVEGTADAIEQWASACRFEVDEIVLEVLGDKLRGRDKALVKAGVPCPVCQEPMTVNRDEPHGWTTSMGPLPLWRSYLECREHKTRFYPLDAQLKLPRQGKTMPLFANALSLLGAELPYEAGQRLLKALTGRELAAKTIDAQTQRDGQTLDDLEREEADRLWPHTTTGHVREVRTEDLQAARESSVSNPPRRARILVLQIDGAMVNLAADPRVKNERAKAARKKRRAKGGKALPPSAEKGSEGSPYRESLQILIYRLEDVVRKKGGKYGKRKKRKGEHRRDRTIILKKQMACVVNDPPRLAKQVNRLARIWRHDEYEVRIFVSDGAEKHWEVAAAYYQFTVGILDINHARQHIHECARALYSKDSAKAQEWGKHWCKHILDHGPEQLLAHLRGLTDGDWTDEGRRLLSNLIVYVEKNRAYMNYPEYLAKGYPIASGAVEGANKHVLVGRCRRSGQQWKRQNLQNVLALRTALLDGRWELAMAAVRQRQAYPAQPVAPTKQDATGPTKTVGPHTAANPPPSRDGTRPPQPCLLPEKPPTDELGLLADLRRKEIRRIQADFAANRVPRPFAAELVEAHP